MTMQHIPLGLNNIWVWRIAFDAHVKTTDATLWLKAL